MEDAILKSTWKLKIMKLNLFLKTCIRIHFSQLQSLFIKRTVNIYILDVFTENP